MPDISTFPLVAAWQRAPYILCMLGVISTNNMSLICIAAIAIQYIISVMSNKLLPYHIIDSDSDSDILFDITHGNL